MTARRLTAMLAISIALGAGTSAAFGYWTGFNGALSGEGAGGAATINQGSAPTADSRGTHVTLTWGASGMSTGHPVDGYVIKRYEHPGGAPQTIQSNCAGTITTTTCTELAMPAGDWGYTVTPVFADNWVGAESAHSGTVQTGPASLSLDQSVVGAPLPTEITGTVTGFVPNEGITYELDGAPITGSPASVGVDGSATITGLTIPAGTGEGPHAIHVIGDDPVSPSEAEASILVDTTPPTINAFTTPAPNAAGWHNTSPVEVNGTVDDGGGSGIASVKYTDDGSDPKTSPTAQYALAPPIATSTTTYKFFGTDLAGNESAVQTLEVKIDTMPPYFTIEIVEVTGNFYIGPTGPQGEPGLSYFRGIEAGSLRFKLTPVPLGGSPVVSAGFSELPAEPVGFTFDSTLVTTPEGGPFLSSVFSWVAGITSTHTPAGTITLTDAAGNTFGGSGSSVNDSTAPSGGSVDASGLTGTGGRYSTSLDLNLNLAKGTDSASGLADGSSPADTPSQLLRASAPLSSSDGVAGGTCGTYSAYAQVGGDDPGATVSDTVPSDATCYRYRYLVPDHLDNVATYQSPDIKVVSEPAPSLRPTNATITPVSGTAAQAVTGSTVYYNPALLGSFNVDSSASAPFAGIAQMTFPALASFTGGGAVTTPTSGTIFRTTYSWSGNGASPSPGVQPLSATGNAGNTATNATAFSVLKDDLAPSGGSVDATGLGGTGGRYSTSTTLSIGFAPGADAGSGLAASGRQLLRSSATLSSDGTGNGICGTFGAYSQVGANDPASPTVDTVPVDRDCYRYRYLVPDRVGNLASYTSPDIKVDATAPPAPALSFSGLSNAYWSGTGTTLFYLPGAAGGGFTVTANSADTTSGTTGYGFPTLPAGWSGSSGGSGIHSYSWSSPNPTAPSGGQAVTANNNAGGQSSATFTATADSAGPTGGSVTYTNGFSTASSVSVAFTQGSDAGSGLASASGLLQRSSATLSNGSCGAFGSFATVATNPTSPSSDSVTTSNCYQYRYLVSDNLGNQGTYTSSSIVKVDTVAPANALSLSSPVGAYLSGTTLYYKRNAIGSFKLVNAVTDASGPASATFPAIGTTGWTHNAETVSTPAGGPYTSTTFSWTANPTNPATKTVTGTDAAGASTNTSVTFLSDITAPATGSVSYTNGLVRALSVPVTTANGTDGGSGINSGSGTVQRSQATLNTGTLVCGTFGAFSTITLTGGNDTGVTTGRCYKYRYLVSDNVGNQATYTSSSVAKVDTTSYANAVLTTTGLVNYWRLGESTISSDTFTGTVGTLLSSRSGEIGATWSAYESPPTTAVLSDENRVRRNGVSGTQYTTSGIPPSANYSVQADIVVKSVLSQDAAGVAARAVAGDDFYLARLMRNGGTTTWDLLKVDNGSAALLASSPATVSAGQTHTVKLTVAGTALTMSVNGSQIASLNDGSFTATGKASLRLGFTGATPAPTDTTGFHIDNFYVTPPADDAQGTNDGTYWNGTTLGLAGAISGDANTAAEFDGAGEYVNVLRQIQDNFSIEFWFKSPQGLNLNAQWWGNAGLVDAEVAGSANDFGVSLRSDGSVVAGTGTPDVSIVSPTAGYNNNVWHHVVFTRTKASGALALYIDGAAAGTAAGSTATLSSPATINFGRIATGSWYYGGTLDEIATYSSVLSAATISNHYTRR